MPVTNYFTSCYGEVRPAASAAGFLEIIARAVISKKPEISQQP